MDNWMIATVPPLLVWFGLFLYLQTVDKRVKKAQADLDAMIERASG